MFISTNETTTKRQLSQTGEHHMMHLMTNAEKEFYKYLNTKTQLDDIPGVSCVRPTAVGPIGTPSSYTDLWNAVYTFGGVTYDITLNRVDSFTLNLVEFVAA